MAREHKGKLTLDNLLIKPVQKFPKYVAVVPMNLLVFDLPKPNDQQFIYGFFFSLSFFPNALYLYSK